MAKPGGLHQAVAHKPATLAELDCVVHGLQQLIPGKAVPVAVIDLLEATGQSLWSQFTSS
jgi:hypothetical protein